MKAIMVIGIIAVLQATSVLPVAAATNDLPDVKETSDRKAIAASSATIDDLFTIAGKPIAVYLTCHADKTWHLNFEPRILGAVAQVRLGNGVSVEMAIKEQKSDQAGNATYSLDTKFSDEKVTFTFHELPNGKWALGMFSERRYANRFRMVWEVRPKPDVGFKLYFLEEPDKASQK